MSKIDKGRITPEFIGNEIRKSANMYLKGPEKGKGTQQVFVKKIISRKIINNQKGGKK